MKKNLLLLVCTFLGFYNSFSQATKNQVLINRCSTVEYEQELRNKNSNRNTIKEFEKWIAPLVTNIKKAQLLNSDSRSATNTVLKIPVVIHIIHNGDAVGTGENISDAQALSQITVLNQDFRKMIATPGYNTNPVGADMEIEFVMAKRNPAGTASTGIDRVNRSPVTQYTTRATVETMKQATVWDSSKYLNMWTIRIGGGTAQWNGTLGYAQFPSFPGIAGIGYNTPATEAQTDGLAMRFDAFGSSTLAPSGTYLSGYDKGRTTTHEIGHWAGLRHIWGDGDCSVDDYCNDTPNAGAANYGCPAGTDSCPTPGIDMIENYMDYTDDTCMNIFTKDQKNRMTAVFQNSPRRNTLLYSDALVPVGLSLEAGISFDKEGIDNCSVSLAPTIRLKNYGTTTITNAQITYSFDSNNPQVVNYTGSLATGASVLITLQNLAFTSATQSYYVNLTGVNSSSTDSFLDNNTLQRKFDRPLPTGNNLTFNLQLDPYGSETSWNLKNSASTILYSGGTGGTGGAYADADPNFPALISIPFNLSNNDCYTLTVSDSYSPPDGLASGGYFEIVDASGNFIVRGGSFQATSVHKFATTALGVSDLEFSDFSLYPNPNNGNFTLKFNSASTNDIKINVYDMRGRNVYEKAFTNNGTFNQDINLDKAQTGIYLVSISDGDIKTVKRIVIN